MWLVSGLSGYLGGYTYISLSKVVFDIPHIIEPMEESAGDAISLKIHIARVQQSSLKFPNLKSVQNI